MAHGGHKEGPGDKHQGMHEIVAADFNHHDVVQVQLTPRCIDGQHDEHYDSNEIDPEITT